MNSVNNSEYYKQKYLKYKFKYLEQKKLIGGIPGVGLCNYVFKTAANAIELKGNYDNEKCFDDAIEDFGPKGFLEAKLIKLDEPRTSNSLIYKFKVSDLKKVGFTAEYLKNFNNNFFNAGKLYMGGFTVEELKTAGFTVEDIVYQLLKNHTFSDIELIETKKFEESIITRQAQRIKQESQREEQQRLAINYERVD